MSIHCLLSPVCWGKCKHFAALSCKINFWWKTGKRKKSGRCPNKKREQERWWQKCCQAWPKGWQGHQNHLSCLYQSAAMAGYHLFYAWDGSGWECEGMDGDGQGLLGTGTWVALAALASSPCCHISPLCKRRKKILSDLMGLPRES